MRYDHEAMIGIVALEAHRAGAVVVGEDLGTVEPWVRDYLRERGLLGTSILWFELDRDGGGGPLAAERWREYCLSSVTTHDLPPTAGYLAGEHVRLRDSLGLLTRPVAEELAEDDRPSRRPGWPSCVGSACWPDGDTDVEQVVLALYQLPGPHAVAAAGAGADRRGRRPAHPEPAGHHRRIPELAGPAERARRPTSCSKTCSPTRGRPRWPTR